MIWVTGSELYSYNMLSLKTLNGLMISRIETLNQQFQTVFTNYYMMMVVFILPITS